MFKILWFIFECKINIKMFYIFIKVNFVNLCVLFNSCNWCEKKVMIFMVLMVFLFVKFIFLRIFLEFFLCKFDFNVSKLFK